ncbi:MAG TPA: DNA replication/repair protein RecF [Spirochaetia bacterium]|nr:DNA replication/repair protein RecF [Spirochaetia bacterium]
MGFSSLRFFHFRNLKDVTVRFDSASNFLVGENGQGKSNCLEALYFLCYGASFRTLADKDLILTGETKAAVQGWYQSPDGVEKEIEIILTADEPKEIRVDGKRVTDRRQILQSIPCVIFSHEDLEFAVGPPLKKRRFFNQTLCMYDDAYLDLLRHYQRVLRQRNMSLKQRRRELLPVYNERLAEYGFAIQKKRQELVKNFSRVFQDYFQRISGLPSPLSIVYRPSWHECDEPAACVVRLEAGMEQDHLFRTTTSGPHPDRFLYTYEGRDFSRIASTGQIRLLSIILRVAQARFFTDCTGRRPLLLLDDVLLELDGEKRKRFIHELPPAEQAFFTFLPVEEYRSYAVPSTSIYRVREGRIEPWSEPEIY